MPFTLWNRLRSPLPAPPRRRAADRRCRPGVEPLEDRRLLTTLVGLSTNNQLLAFDSNTPGTIDATVPVTGLPAGESLLDIDARPATGQLYGLGSSGRLYVIDGARGAATPVGSGPFTVPLRGTAFGIDFDPVSDRLRVVSNAGQNLRVNPDTGAAVADADLNPPGSVVSVAYSNNFVGASSTTLFGIDSASDMFVQIGGSDGNPSPDLGAVTPVISIGADTSEQAGLDIGPDNTGFAAVTSGGRSQLVGVSLSAGPFPIGPIGDGSVGVRGLAVFVPPSPPPPPPPPAPSPGDAVILFAATRTNELLSFSSATPGAVASTTPITGLVPGELILGLDVRPATGQLYALGSTSRLYIINPATGAATQVGTGTFAVPLMGMSFGFAFDPVTDRIRVVSDANQNMRLDPDTGAVIDGDPNTPGTQPDAFLSSTYTVGAAYSDNGAGATTLYGIDGANGWLVRVGGPNGSPSPNRGQITVIGPLGIHPDWAPVPAAPFDITAGGTPFAALQVGGRTSLYLINLATGAATGIGPIGAGSSQIVGLTAALPSPAASPSHLALSSAAAAAAEGAGSFQITVTLSAAMGVPVTVDFSTADGTAVAGQDYTASRGTVVFQPGETSKTIVIPIVNDTQSEGPKTLTVTLSNPTGGATLGSPSSAVLTITDDDAVQPSPPSLPPLAPSTPPVAPVPGTPPNQCFVMQLYRDLLGREADPGGLANWSGQLDRGLVTRAQVAMGIEGSVEFRLRALQAIYNQLLQRPLDQSGGYTWMGFLQGGGTLEQVADFVLGSQEYYVRRGGGTDSGFLTAVYGDVLGRAPDAGAAGWGQAMRAGATRTAVAQAILASTESNVREVQGIYRGLLRRNADPSGLTAWVGAAGAGVSDEAIAAAIAGSDEYLARACGLGSS
jgi:hypothetical protein